VKRPNFLFIHTDQHAGGALSCAGNPNMMTLHLDALAARGVRFTRSYCTSPLCTPARASYTTGRVPHASGIRWNHQRMDPAVPQMGDVLRRAGYETAWVGKWHVPEEYPPEPDAIPGFDNLPIEGRNLAGGPYPVRITGTDGWDHNLGLYVDRAVAQTAVTFLRRKHNQPFLLSVALMNPHDICFPSEYCRWGPPDESRLPPLPANFEPPEGEPGLLAETRFTHEWSTNWAKEWNEKGWREAAWLYHRMVEHADGSIGVVLDALREAGLEKDTVVIYTSDHGEGAASHRWIGKLSLYDEAVAVPLVVSCPGTVPEGVADAQHLVSAVDIFPTVCDFAGIEPPPGLDGISLRKTIENPSSPDRPFVGCALYPVGPESDVEGRMIRTPKFKYTAFSREKNPEMLVDMEADPGEMRNLAGTPSMKGVLDEHRRFLKEWLANTRDGFRLSAI